MEMLEEGKRDELLALANLEAALIEQMYSLPVKAAEYLTSAQEAAKFTAQLTGQPLA